MAGELLATVTFQAATNLPKDQVVNTFAFDATGAPVTQTYADLVTALNDWLNGPDTNANRISNFIAPSMSRTAPPVARFYRVENNLAGLSIANGGVPAGSPVYQAALSNLSVAQGAGFPEEVAVVATLRADQYAVQPVERADGSDAGTKVDRPRQRYTGRQFIGPLTDNAASGTTARVVAPIFITCLTQAYGRLRVASTSAGAGLSVWSRADAMFRPVSHLEVDNAFDTQRRRGRSATSKTVTAI